VIFAPAYYTMLGRAQGFAATLGDGRITPERRDVPHVLERLRRDVPPGTLWTFDYEGDRAWVRAESTVELGASVRAALAGR
jgi:hypothetical protein